MRLLKIGLRSQRLLTLLERASKGDEMSKSLWKSKVFWFNVIVAAQELLQVLPLPPGAVAIGATVINIGLRVVTDKPVTVLPQ